MFVVLVMHYGLSWYSSSLSLFKTLKSKYKIPVSTIGGLIIYLAYHYTYQYLIYKQVEARYSKQVGQMIMVGFQGTDEKDLDGIVKNIESGYVGGVILFGGTEAKERNRSNVVNPRQLIVLTSFLQHRATIPLLIATNQEGGKRDNLSAITKTPLVGIHEAMELPDIDLVRAYAQSGRDMLLFGFNTNLAPVIDLPSNVDKDTIKQNVDNLFRVSKTFIRTYKSSGVKTCLKHFPGIRDYKESKDLTQYRLQRQIELYKSLIDSEHVDMIMVSREYADLDHGMPGFMSKKTIDYLKTHFDFEGVILTDSIESIGSFSKEEIIIKSINAGANIIVDSNSKNYDPEVAKTIHNVIIKAIVRNQIEPSKIEASYDKIMALKNRLGGLHW